jgi:hypothetical protein
MSEIFIRLAFLFVVFAVSVVLGVVIERCSRFNRR